jgi:sortase A
MTAATLAGESGRFRLPAWARRRADRPPVEVTTAASVAQWILLVLAGLAVWFGVFAAWLSGFVEQHAQHGLYASFRAQLAGGTAPLGGAIGEGRAVAMLQSSAAGLHDLVVVEGTTASDLRSGPGHYPGTPLPGQAGISYVFGRSFSFGGPFAHITQLRPGDTITATTGEGTFTYAVQGISRSNGKVLAPPAGGGELMLVTSEGTGWRSGWAPSHAVFVYALLKGKPAGAPPAIGLIKSADRPMHGDTSNLFVLVLWLQLLLIAVVAIVWARAKWGAWQPWLIGVPIVLAALWGASSAAWPLLPNLV